MKASEIRDLGTVDAIQAKLNDIREELLRLRFQQATGELTDFSRLRVLRRDIARLMTILEERKRQELEEGVK